MTTTYTTIRDLAADLAETMGLERQAVERAISSHRALFGRYEDLTADEIDALSRAVWADLTDGSTYPW